MFEESNLPYAGKILAVCEKNKSKHLLHCPNWPSGIQQAYGTERHRNYDFEPLKSNSGSSVNRI